MKVNVIIVALKTTQIELEDLIRGQAIPLLRYAAGMLFRTTYSCSSLTNKPFAIKLMSGISGGHVPMHLHTQEKVLLRGRRGTARFAGGRFRLHRLLSCG